MFNHTLPGLLKEVASGIDRPGLLNFRSEGVWHSLSTSQMLKWIERTALGLFKLGIKRGESVGLIASSSPFWLMTDLAIMIAGGVTVPIFKRISPESMAFESKDSKIRYIFVGVGTEVDAVRSYGKGIKKIIPLNLSVEGEDVLPLEELQQMGRELAESSPSFFQTLIQKIKGSDLATIIYTSGSTGIPKGVELTHENITAEVEMCAKRFELSSDKDIAVSSLPLAHIFERMVIYFYLSRRISIYFVDDLTHLGEIIREVKPTIMTVVPRLLEKVYSKMKNKALHSHGLKKKIALAALRRAETKEVNQPFKGIKDFFFNKLVFSKFRKAMGGHLKMVISGAAPLALNLSRFFINVGIPIFEGYGLTEAAPVIAANYPGHNKPGTVGPLFPDVEVKIAPDGEILAHGPDIMRKYHNNKKATSAVLDKDHWLHTGDLGKIDPDGYLIITGRKKELFKKSTGEYVAPIPIEQKLAEHPFIDMAVVVADSRKFVSCLIFPDYQNIEEVKKKIGMVNRGNDEFLESVELQDEIKSYIKQINHHFHHTEEIQRFRIIKSPLSIEAGELTPTMKIRRHIVEEKYHDLIDQMYSA